MKTLLGYVPIAPKASAQALAKRLVEQRLVACANLHGPIQSTYRWEGKVEAGEEWILILKTTDGRRADVERFLGEHHPYDLHGVLWIEPAAVNAPFAAWIADAVSP